MDYDVILEYFVQETERKCYTGRITLGTDKLHYFGALKYHHSIHRNTQGSTMFPKQFHLDLFSLQLVGIHSVCLLLLSSC